MRRLLPVLILLALACSACSRTNLADVVKALSSDPNGWCVRDNLGTVYGTNTGFIGRGGPNTSIRITSDACEIIGSNVTNVVVPTGSVTVTPSLGLPVRP